MDQITPLQKPDHTILVNQTWLRNLRRECQGWTEEKLNEYLTGVKVIGAIEKDLESEV